MKLRITILLFLFFCFAQVVNTEEVYYDWAIGRIISVTEDLGGFPQEIRLTIGTDKLTVSVQCRYSAPCQDNINEGMLVRFRIRSPSFWSSSTPLVQFYFLQGVSQCIELGYVKIATLEGGKKRKVDVNEGTAFYIHKSGFLKSAEQRIIEKAWWENAVQRVP